MKPRHDMALAWVAAAWLATAASCMQSQDARNERPSAASRGGSGGRPFPRAPARGGPAGDAANGKEAGRYLSSWGRTVLANCVSVAAGTVKRTYSVNPGIAVAGFEISEVLWGLGTEGVTILVTSPDPSWFRQGDRSVMLLAADEGSEHFRPVDKIDLGVPGGDERLDAARKYVSMEAIADPAEKRTVFKGLLFAGLSSADRWVAENSIRELYILTGREPGLFDSADIESMTSHAKSLKGEARDNLLYCAAQVETIPALIAASEHHGQNLAAGPISRLAALFDPEGPASERVRYREDVVFQVYRATDAPALRAGVVAAAAEVGTPRLVNGVYKALWDASPAVRASALRGLRRRGSGAHCEQVKNLLADPFPEVRLEAVLALARVGNKSVQRVLEKLAADETELPDIRAAAAKVAAALRGA